MVIPPWLGLLEFGGDYANFTSSSHSKWTRNIGPHVSSTIPFDDVWWNSLWEVCDNPCCTKKASYLTGATNASSWSLGFQLNSIQSSEPYTQEILKAQMVRHFVKETAHVYKRQWNNLQTMFQDRTYLKLYKIFIRSLENAEGKQVHCEQKWGR
jgi:hypothetical protein